MSKKSKTNSPVKVPVLVFNRANAKTFGEMLYSDKKGVVSFVKLCDGTLRNGKDGGKTLHCAIGEAYATFVEPKVSTPFKTVDKMKEEYVSKYIDETGDEATLVAVDALVDVAQLKSNTQANKEKLALALHDIVGTNDSYIADGHDLEEYVVRAKKVSEAWRTEVLPLLK